MTEYVAVLDAGSQFGKVIDRRLRELHLEARLMPLSTTPEAIKADSSIKAVVITGGPTSVYAADAPAFDSTLFEKLGDVPILGICYGMQLLCHAFGGKVATTEAREDGQDTIACEVDRCVLFQGLAHEQKVLLTHGDSVTDVGEQMEVVARSSGGVVAAVQRKDTPLHVGVQFHPEVDLTEQGTAMFRNFFVAAGCSFSYTMDDRESRAIDYIRSRVDAAGPDVKVLCLVSGGVDSSVCAALLHKAIGTERTVCLHVDHGFMRHEESKAVVESLSAVGVELHVVDAFEDFLRATTEVHGKTTAKLGDAIHPEEKRKIIGDTFMRITDRATAELKLDSSKLLLAQGTLRPDLIESGSHLASKQAETIKTHHNDTQLVRELRAQGRIIEPLADYHKDEVRALGTSLGLPPGLVQRQPFPGPGLAIRVLCADGPQPGPDDVAAATTANTVLSGQKDTPYLSAATRAGLTAAFGSDASLTTTVIPIRCVGVQGDGRTYAQALAVCAPSAVTESSWPFVMAAAGALPKVVKSINRTVFVFPPPSGLRSVESVARVTPTTLTSDVLDKLRQADHIVNTALSKHNLLRRLSQVPVVLLPVVFSDAIVDEATVTHSIVIRTFITNDFMTGVPAVPGSDYLPLACLEEMVSGIYRLPWVSRVLFDMTAKPPGTTEWE